MDHTTQNSAVLCRTVHDVLNSVGVVVGMAQVVSSSGGGSARWVHRGRWRSTTFCLFLALFSFLRRLPLYSLLSVQGCEFAVVEEMASVFTRDAPPFGQILMEIHDTRNVTSMVRLIGTLENLGYRLFHTEVNAYHSQCYEIALIHETLVRP